MKPLLNKKLLVKLGSFANPKIILLQEKWRGLTQREKFLLSIMLGLMGVFFIYTLISGAVNYKRKISEDISVLRYFSLYAQQQGFIYKKAETITTPNFSPVSLDNIKKDVDLILQIKNPDVILQDNQLTIDVNDVGFSDAMRLLEQLRRSYGIFPSELSIIRQSRLGYIAFKATFTVKQS